MNYRCKSLFVLSLAILLAACDNEGNGKYTQKRLPEGTQVTVNPESTEWLIDVDGVCVPDPLLFSDELVTIFVSDPEGKALGDVDLTVSISLAENTFSGPLPPVALYDDRNGDLTFMMG